MRPSAPKPIQVPSAEFGRIFDRLITTQRLVLALHRLEQGNRGGGCISTPGELIAWEAFLAIHSASEELGQIAGYQPEERRPE